MNIISRGFLLVAVLTAVLVVFLKWKNTTPAVTQAPSPLTVSAQKPPVELVSVVNENDEHYVPPPRLLVLEAGPRGCYGNWSKPIRRPQRTELNIYPVQYEAPVEGERPTVEMLYFDAEVVRENGREVLRCSKEPSSDPIPIGEGGDDADFIRFRARKDTVLSLSWSEPPENRRRKCK